MRGVMGATLDEVGAGRRLHDVPARSHNVHRRTVHTRTGATAPDTPESAGSGGKGNRDRPDGTTRSGGEASSTTTLTRKERFKKFTKEYGMPGVAIYTVVTVTDLALLYGAVRMGVDVCPVLEHMNLTWLTEGKAGEATETYGPFVVAYGAHKLLMPARFALTFAITPPIVRRLRAKGWIGKRSESE